MEEEKRSIRAIMGDMKALVDGFTPEAERFIEGRKRATHFIDTHLKEAPRGAGRRK